MPHSASELAASKITLILYVENVGVGASRLARLPPVRKKLRKQVRSRCDRAKMGLTFSSSSACLASTCCWSSSEGICMYPGVPHSSPVRRQRSCSLSQPKFSMVTLACVNVRQWARWSGVQNMYVRMQQLTEKRQALTLQMP